MRSYKIDRDTNKLIETFKYIVIGMVLTYATWSVSQSLVNSQLLPKPFNYIFYSLPILFLYGFYRVAKDKIRKL